MKPYADVQHEQGGMTKHMKRAKGRKRTKVIKRMQVLVMSMILAGTVVLGGCRKAETTKSEEKAIVVAVNSETGGLDPAGMIALTYLSYSVTALDELLTYDENGEIGRAHV